MPKFKLTVSYPSLGKSESLEVEGSKAVTLVGRRIGETVDGSSLGLPGRKLLITGASDRDGFPLRPNVRGAVKKHLLLTSGVGYRPTSKGARARKLVRGNIITEDVSQVNLKALEGGKEASSSREGAQTGE